jgi:large subunit ribosomal protein L10
MTRQNKEKVVEALTSEFETASTIIACGYTGLTVLELEELRISAREKDVKVQVVKNRLAKIALDRNDLAGLDLTNMNILLWGDDAITTSKIVSKFASSNKKFEIKSAFIDKEIADVAKVEAFAKLPGREELLGMLAAVWMAPVRNWTIGLNALKEKKENPDSAE